MEGWQNTWQGILEGGAKRWKLEEKEQLAYDYLSQVLAESKQSLEGPINIFIPLAGDCHMIYIAYALGFNVFVNEWVPGAVASLKSQLPSVTISLFPPNLILILYIIYIVYTILYNIV